MAKLSSWQRRHMLLVPNDETAFRPRGAIIKRRGVVVLVTLGDTCVDWDAKPMGQASPAALADLVLRPSCSH